MHSSLLVLYYWIDNRQIISCIVTQSIPVQSYLLGYSRYGDFGSSKSFVKMCSRAEIGQISYFILDFYKRKDYTKVAFLESFYWFSRPMQDL